jgi:hypothetical protein
MRWLSTGSAINRCDIKSTTFQTRESFMYLRPAFLMIAATASLLLGTTALQADESAIPPRPGQEFCKENPGKCEEARAKRKEFCTANPEKCAAQRKQMKQEMRQRRDEMKAQCKADPAKCEEMKQEMRQKYQGKYGSGQGKPAE